MGALFTYGKLKSKEICRESYMMSADPKVQKGVNKIIKKIKDLELNGETVQYIFEETGNEEQMLRQLVMEAPIEDIFELLDEKRAIEEEEE